MTELFNSYKTIILTPVFNDWESLALLVEAMGKKLEPEIWSQTRVIVVDDGSVQLPEKEWIEKNRRKVDLVHLTRNMGHQKAIAIGLSYIHAHYETEQIIVMDSDGEDKPEDINTILLQAKKAPDKIIFATRKKRHEGFLFRLFYVIYKLIFKLLTGKVINFGNFSLIPGHKLKKVVHVTEIWNHYSGGVMKSKLPYISIPLEKGFRLHGESKMNFNSLIFHGLSAVAVHAEVMAVRLVVASLWLIALSVLAIFTVAYIKFFIPSYASPGWATTVITGFTDVIMQTFVISLLLLFNVLMYRTQKVVIPALDYKNFIDPNPEK